MRKSLKVVGIVIVVLVVIAGGLSYYFSSQPSGYTTSTTGIATSTPGPLTTFTWASSTDTDLWDPYRDNTATSTSVYYLVFDPLVHAWPDSSGNVVFYPALAVSWTNPDNNTWIFNLRHNVRFHSGNVMTSKDVVWTFERVLTWNNMTFGQKGYLTGMAGITNVLALDDYTVEFKTKGPHGAFLSAISYFMYIFEEDCATRADFGISVPDCGTGPFQLTDYVKGDHYTLVRFDAYWDQANLPKVDRIVVRYVPDPASRVAAFQAGQVDGFDRPAPPDVQRLQSAGSFVEIVPNIDLMEYMINVQKPPFDNIDVRQAANLAIDRDSIIKHVLFGIGSRADSEVQLGIFGALNITQYLGRPAFQYDPAQAKQLLQKAGYKGEEIDMEVMVGYSTADLQVGEAIQGYLNAVGFNVKLISLEVDSMVYQVVDFHTAVMNGTLAAKDIPYHLFANPWSSAPDTEITADALISINGAYGMTFYENPQMEKLITEAVTETNVTARQNMYYQVQMMVYNEVAYIPLYTDANVVILKQGISGLKYFHEITDMRGVTISTSSSQAIVSNLVSTGYMASPVRSIVDEIKLPNSLRSYNMER
jgi:peptide/nickel transport system substrate-binding protein